MIFGNQGWNIERMKLAELAPSNDKSNKINVCDKIGNSWLIVMILVNMLQLYILQLF